MRAVSFVGAGPEPGWLDKMLGAEAMSMQQAPKKRRLPKSKSRQLRGEKSAKCQVMKCDGRSAAEAGRGDRCSDI